MLAIATTNGIAGYLGPGAMLDDPDSTQRFPLGMVLEGVDPFGIFGAGEFIYLKAAATITANQICVYNVGLEADVAANTANTGRAVVVAKAPMATGEYGWFQLSGGMIPVKTAASVAAGSAVGIDATTGGSAAANSAGRQILGATSLRASTATRVFTGTTRTGSKVVKLASQAAGVFLDQAVSGTGIAASSEVADISSNGLEVTLTEAATAGGTVTVTFTNTGYIEIAAPAGMILQGAIT